MAKLDASCESLTRTESVAERADAYRVALRLLTSNEWAESVTPDDALRLAMFLTEELGFEAVEEAEE